jgi:peptidyl-prolyl cis-trans isomerase C
MKKQILTSVAAALVMSVCTPVAWAQNLAIVNGKAVPTARLDALVQQLNRSGRQITPEMQGKLKEAVISREIFTQEAQARGLDASDNFKTQMELNRQTILINELFADFQKNNPVTDAEAQAEYDKFVAANSGKEFRARHILVEKESEAKAVIAQLKKGAKFDALAKKLSKDPGAPQNGGELDWAPANSYVAEFAEALIALGKGKTTEQPVKTQFGFHVIRLEDVREAQLPKLDEIKPQIIEQLKQQKLAKFQEDLRTKAKVE